MESTGVVRRIDDLGRIVIPKEIRRTLRIKDGSSLEIFVEKDMVALKKHSSMNSLLDFAELYAESIYHSLKKTVIITDRDNIIAVSGPEKKEITDVSISKFLDKCLKERNNVIEKEITTLNVTEDKKLTCSYTLNTIISNGDSIGLFIITSEKPLSDIEIKTAEIATKFLGKHIEE